MPGWDLPDFDGSGGTMSGAAGSDGSGSGEVPGWDPVVASDTPPHPHVQDFKGRIELLVPYLLYAVCMASPVSTYKNCWLQVCISALLVLFEASLAQICCFPRSFCQR